MKLVRALAIVVALGVSLVAHAQDKYSYTVKGVIRALPGNGRAANEILVKHEPIPEYRDESGKVVGMMGMTMPFYLSADAPVSDLHVGDKIEMVVEQQLQPTFAEKVVSIKKVN